MKKLVAAILLIIMAISLCACGSGNSDTSVASGAESSKPTESEAVSSESEETVSDTGNAYVVTVVDGDNNPVSGAILQMCKLGDDGSCTPGNPSDDQGKVAFSLPEDDYKVSFLIMPDGYTYVGEEKEFYFEEGSKELKITLAKAN